MHNIFAFAAIIYGRISSVPLSANRCMRKPRSFVAHGRHIVANGRQLLVGFLTFPKTINQRTSVVHEYGLVFT